MTVRALVPVRCRLLKDSVFEFAALKAAVQDVLTSEAAYGNQEEINASTAELGLPKEQHLFL